ncbi:hypothetical protein BC834DRAFT_970853 [Gloeopeniophorella convolvens]|nr:hypothetical protein BC834DRAFT_970853 [Gloeopeniophorella convolvens]
MSHVKGYLGRSKRFVSDAILSCQTEDAKCVGDLSDDTAASALDFFVATNRGMASSKVSRSVLSPLSSRVSSNVRKAEAAYTNKSVPFPSLDTSHYQPGSPDNDVKAIEPTRIIVSAATQLVAAAICSPTDSLLEHVSGTRMTASLGLVVGVDVADVLEDAGPDGLHVNDIGRAVSIGPSKLSRIRRHLATSHVFKEVSPEDFANNRLSSAISKAKPFSKSKADKLSKYDDMPVAAFVGHVRYTVQGLPNVTADAQKVCKPYILMHWRDNEFLDSSGKRTAASSH